MKKIRNTGITGQQGVNIIEKVVLEMGSLWHPTSGLEAGTDGFIEFRDPITGEVLNLLLPVQSKATAHTFSSETATSFAFICEREDIDYWMQGNRPIILVVSRPSTSEAYWVSLKEYFGDPKRRQSRKVIFDKDRDRFDASARDRLMRVAVPETGGTYLAPARRQERVYTNLLRVTRLPSRLYHGYTQCATGAEVRTRLREMDAQGMEEWATRGKRVVSIHDLRTGPWRSICDQGTVEDFDVEDWSRSPDPDQRSDFLELLHRCLRARLFGLHVRYDRDLRHFHFTATKDLTPRIISARSFSRESPRTVFARYMRKNDPDTVDYFRHHAFEGRFRGYDGEWFLQIDPTYRFTSDGYRIDRLSAKRLSGIHKLEKNPAVIGQVLMWASLLGDPVEQQTLFAEPLYPHLGFGGLETFDSPVGIDDEAWVSSDDNPESRDAAEQASGLNLFDMSTGA